jgi:hypothetical protein
MQFWTLGVLVDGMMECWPVKLAKNEFTPVSTSKAVKRAKGLNE